MWTVLSNRSGVCRIGLAWSPGAEKGDQARIGQTVYKLWLNLHIEKPDSAAGLFHCVLPMTTASLSSSVYKV